MNQSPEVIFALWQANQAVRDLVDDWAEADPERVSVADFNEEAWPRTADGMPVAERRMVQR